MRKRKLFSSRKNRVLLAVLIVAVLSLSIIPFSGANRYFETEEEELAIQIKVIYEDGSSSDHPGDISLLSLFNNVLAVFDPSQKAVAEIQASIILYIEYAGTIESATYSNTLNVDLDSVMEAQTVLALPTLVSGQSHQLGSITITAEEIETWASTQFTSHDLLFSVPSATIHIIFTDASTDSMTFSTASASIILEISEELPPGESTGIITGNIDITTGTPEEPSVLSILTVSGQNVIDSASNIVKLSGTSLYSSDVFYSTSRIEQDLANVKSWGFNTVQLVFHWTRHIEMSESQVGVYDESNLAKMGQVIQWAEAEGLYVVLSMRESGSAWTNEAMSGAWSYPDMFDPTYRAKAIADGGMIVPAEEWDHYFDRCLNAWRHIIQRFDAYDNVIGYNLLFFPWHGQDPFTVNWQSPTNKYLHYESTMVPAFLSMLRVETDKIYFYTPVNQGRFTTPEASAVVAEGYPLGELQNDALASTGGYDQDITRNGIGALTPIADSNVVYCSGGHRPKNVELHQSPYTWTGTSLQMQFLTANYYPLKQFMNAYNVPGMITEMGLKYFGVTRPTAQWRLDGLEDKMTVINDYGINWVWWQYHVYNSESLVDENNVRNEIGDVLVNYIP